jgi:glucose/arabinose dehydrogenase
MKSYRYILLVLILTACSGSVGPKTSAVDATQAGTMATNAAPPAPASVTTVPSVTQIPDTPTASRLPTDTPRPTNTTAPSQTATPEVIQATSLPDANAYTWQEVVGGLASPVGLAQAGDGSERLFILEQSGVILIWQNGALLSQPFLDIRQRVGSNGSERGLLGLAFHPQYAQNGYFYINYTDLSGNTVIARFQVSNDDPNVAQTDSETQLLYVRQPFANHNGGEVSFGPDGYLYLGLGDGGSAGDPNGNGQSLATFLGKILRLDVNGGAPYAIPPDNPFANGGGLPEIWAYGLRNPWRFSFDRLTGDLYIGDVGQNSWEEIDFLPAGSPGGTNFGWNIMEGFHPYQGATPANVVLTPPVVEYGHDMGCSVTGGVVYRGERLPAWQGVYLFGDYCSGNVWGLLQDAQGNWQSRLLFETRARITSFGEDEAGEVYMVDYGGTINTLIQK